MQSPFHEGELQVQQLAHEEAIAERNGVMIADRIMGGALPFLAQQSMVVFGSRDSQERLWASMVFGSPGFMSSANGRTVDFDLSLTAVQEHDPIWQNIEVNQAVGMLAIELGTRRRIRMNGDISRPAENKLQLTVREAFPNCPKYITRRMIRTLALPKAYGSEWSNGLILGPEQKQILERTDVLFIATAHPARGADVSHRGGNPGFVQVMDVKTLRIPDYAGNSMFNTLGNLVVNQAAGLVIPDFEHGRALLLTGKGEIVFNDDRFLLFSIEEWRQLAIPAEVKTEFLDYSRFNP